MTASLGTIPSRAKASHAKLAQLLGTSTASLSTRKKITCGKWAQVLSLTVPDADSDRRLTAKNAIDGANEALKHTVGTFTASRDDDNRIDLAWTRPPWDANIPTRYEIRCGNATDTYETASVIEASLDALTLKLPATLMLGLQAWVRPLVNWGHAAPKQVAIPLRDAKAPTLAIGEVDYIWNERHVFSAMIAGGVYDRLEVVWSVPVGSRGTCTGNTLESGVFLPGSFLGNSYTTRVRCRVIARGDGVNAADGTSETVEDIEEFTVYKALALVYDDIVEAIESEIPESPGEYRFGRRDYTVDPISHVSSYEVVHMGSSWAAVRDNVTTGTGNGQSEARFTVNDEDKNLVDHLFGDPGQDPPGTNILNQEFVAGREIRIRWNATWELRISIRNASQSTSPAGRWRMGYDRLGFVETGAATTIPDQDVQFRYLDR